MNFVIVAAQRPISFAMLTFDPATVAAWAVPAALLGACAGGAAAWCYRGAPRRRVVFAAATLKGVAVVALAWAILDPQWTGVRPRRGANLWAVVVDDSQSLQIHDAGAAQSRGEQLRAQLLAESSWQTRLADEFNLRRLTFAEQLRGVDDFGELSFDGPSSDIGEALRTIARRYRGLPLAGILLMSDGNATDALDDGVPWSELPPIYPAPVGQGDVPHDVRVEQVAATDANFEQAPLTITARVRDVGVDREAIAVTLRDEQGQVVAQEEAIPPAAGEAATVRFELPAAAPGVSFYEVGALPAGTGAEAASAEATLANNRRLVAIDRGGGPYRVLYVGGRPNWEFKFLRRALAEDDQLELVGLIRIAKRQPKFSFRPRGASDANPLFEGFEHPAADAAESYDEPVLIRLGAKDEHELRDGFPRTAQELFRYDALIIDDLEAVFFSADQRTLIEEFVSRRGGGLLMLGGVDTFAAGGYRRTPIGDLLPVYLESARDEEPTAGQQYRLALTRDGWLEPWVRLRPTEAQERDRLSTAAPASTLSVVGLMKPGAAVLVEAVDPAGRRQPALAVQRFGRGRSAALLVGDMFRGAMRRRDERDHDLNTTWRQTARWLVAETPRRVEAKASIAAAGSPRIAVRLEVRDAEYFPLDNATVRLEVVAPDHRQFVVEASAAAAAGVYEADFAARTPGAYRIHALATGSDGADVGQDETGEVVQPLADEFRRLAPDRDALARIAQRTGGEVVPLDRLDDFADQLQSRAAPISEPWSRPLWHRPGYLAIVLGCLAAEWGLRRWKGLA